MLDDDRYWTLARSLKARQAALGALALLALAGCSSMPGWSKPWTWFGTSTPEAPPPDKPYPKLGTVPDKPALTPEEERKKLMQGLVADHEHAVHTDEALRATDPDKPTEAKSPPK